MGAESRLAILSLSATELRVTELRVGRLVQKMTNANSKNSTLTGDDSRTELKGAQDDNDDKDQ